MKPDMQEDNIAIRLKILIQKLGITSSMFADRCGISRATLSQLLTGRNKKISDVIFSQIHEAYPSLSIMWLMFNEGQMWLGQPDDAEYSEAGKNDDDNTDNTDDLNKEQQEEPEETSGPSSCQKNASENRKSPYNLQDQVSEGKENGVNCIENRPQSIENKEINNCLKTSELINEIEFLKKKRRNVVQITIYYDDNTFESFYPR